MKKLNLVCAAVAVFCATVANAGTLTGSTTFAVENFTGTATSATTVRPTAVTYSMGTSTTLNPNAKLYFIIRLAGGQFASAYAPVFGEFQVGGVASAAAAGAGVIGVIATVSADKTTMQVEVDNSTTTTTTLGLGALVWTPAAGALDTVNSTLATAGGAVSATVAVSTTSMGSGAGLNSSVTLVPTVDGTAPTATIATSKNAVAVSVSDLSDVGYGNQIDLTADPAGSDYVTTGQMALDSVKFKNASSAPVATDGTTAYTIATKVNGGKITVTPGTGQAFPIGATLKYDITDDSCGALLGSAVTITSANAAKPATLTVAAGDLITNTPIYVCMSAPGVVSTVQQTAAPITATLVGTTTPTAAADGNDTATGTGYAVTFNGKSVTLNSYFPAAISEFGYTPFVRIINTGGVAADISAAIVNGTTGETGTSAVVAAGLKPGAAVLVTNATIEAAIGAQPRDSRPRLQISGPTNGIRVQNFLQNADGSIAELSGAQDGQ